MGSKEDDMSEWLDGCNACRDGIIAEMTEMVEAENMTVTVAAKLLIKEIIEYAGHDVGFRWQAIRDLYLNHKGIKL